jgi:hypothetical protein
MKIKLLIILIFILITISGCVSIGSSIYLPEKNDIERLGYDYVVIKSEMLDVSQENIIFSSRLFSLSPNDLELYNSILVNIFKHESEIEARNAFVNPRNIFELVDEVTNESLYTEINGPEICDENFYFTQKNLYNVGSYFRCGNIIVNAVIGSKNNYEKEKIYELSRLIENKIKA